MAKPKEGVRVDADKLGRRVIWPVIGLITLSPAIGAGINWISDKPWDDNLLHLVDFENYGADEIMFDVGLLGLVAYGLWITYAVPSKKKVRRMVPVTREEPKDTWE